MKKSSGKLPEIPEPSGMNASQSNGYGPSAADKAQMRKSRQAEVMARSMNHSSDTVRKVSKFLGHGSNDMC